MKRKRTLIIVFGIMLIGTLSFSAITFAWIQYQQQLSNQINVAAGSLSIDNLTLTPYKLFYPDYTGSYSSSDELINYDGVTAINPSPNRGYEMNLLDPSYLTINTDKTISDLNTNLVFKVDFSVSYSTPITMNLAVKTKTVTLGGNEFGASGYLHYTALTPTVSSTYASSTATQIFAGAKAYAEDTADHPSTTFGSNSSINLFGASGVDLVTSATYSPSHANPQEFYFFFNVDYDRTLCNYFFDSTRLGNDYTLVTDYFFELSVVQKE